MYLLNENVSIEPPPPTQKKTKKQTNKQTYWMKMHPSNEKVSIKWKCAYWKMKRHNCLVFLNVYVVFIYIATWRNKEWSTKLNFSVLYIYIYISFLKKELKKNLLPIMI